MTIYPHVAKALPKFFDALDSLENIDGLYPDCGTVIPVLHDGEAAGSFVFTPDECWVFEPVTPEVKP